MTDDPRRDRPQAGQTRRNFDPRDLAASLLDRPFERSAALGARAYAADFEDDGVVARALRDFEAEAARLAALGEQMTANNTVFRGLVGAVDEAMTRQRAALEARAQTIQEDAAAAAGSYARQTVLPGFTDGQLGLIGVGWNRPDPEAIIRAAGYTLNPTWTAELDAYQTGVSDAVRDAVLRGIAAGKGNRAIARQVRDIVTGMPLYRANTLARTLQLESFRGATTANYLANAGILEPYAIRIAALDQRTCMCCVSLHGSRVPLNQKLRGHHNCRCTTVASLRGRERVVRSGADWFNSLSPAQQQEKMGAAAYTAYRAGAITLNDFVQPYQDRVFGPMLREASLKGMLGDQASVYYGGRSGRSASGSSLTYTSITLPGDDPNQGSVAIPRGN
jgi:uncharacterized protein YaaQ